MQFSKWQTGGTVVSAVFTAGSIIADGIGFAPNWPWQWFALAGFFVFACLMGIKIYQLECKRPMFSIGQKTGIDISDKIVIKLYFKNIGEKPAENTRLLIGYTREMSPNQFVLFPELSSANRIDPSPKIEHGYEIPIENISAQDIQKLPTFRIWIFCKFYYTDYGNNGRKYSDEFWYSFNFNNKRTESLSIDNKNTLKPFVDIALKRAGFIN